MKTLQEKIYDRICVFFIVCAAVILYTNIVVSCTERRVLKNAYVTYDKGNGVYIIEYKGQEHEYQ